MESTVQAGTAEQGQLSLAVRVPRQRVATRDLVTIGQTWRRRRDGSLWRIWQVHRADRLVELVPADGQRAGVRAMVLFRDLRSYYALERVRRGL